MKRVAKLSRNVSVVLLGVALAAHGFAAGRDAESAAEYEKTLAALEAEAGPDAPELMPWLNHLALLYREAADYGRARHFAERALGIAETQKRTETADGASVFANLGAIAEMQGETAEANTKSGVSLDAFSLGFGFGPQSL